MAHSGPFRCQCGQIHGDIYDGPSNDLLPYIDLDGVAALNAAEAGTARRIFKGYDERLDEDAVALESEDFDPQLIISIPFTCPVKIRALIVMGGADGAAPRTLRAFVNHESLDFADADARPPVQEWDLAEDLLGTIEYPTRFSRFQNVSRLWLYVYDNHGADATRISYIGLSGVGTEHQRRAVQAVYEARPQLKDHEVKDDALGGAVGPSM